MPSQSAAIYCSADQCNIKAVSEIKVKPLCPLQNIFSHFFFFFCTTPILGTVKSQMAAAFTRGLLPPQLASKGLIPPQRCSGFPPAVCTLSCLYSRPYPVPCPLRRTSYRSVSAQPATQTHTLILLWLTLPLHFISNVNV